MLKRFGNDSVYTTLHLYLHYNKLSFSVTLCYADFSLLRYPGERRVYLVRQHGGIATMLRSRCCGMVHQPALKRIFTALKRSFPALPACTLQ
ncbi:hypothetical protein Pelo_5189 [Pelomyxa schiedti]|nr:hypothetical protein Pelo_5189 [Pelomyxa schiedti]